MAEEPSPCVDFAAKDDYAVYSETLGLISSHMTSTAAIQYFASHARNNPDTDALIYKRGKGGWEVF